MPSRQGAPVADGIAKLLALGLLLLSCSARAYDPEVHQRMTFIAAKTLNRCVEGGDVVPLTPLQVRFIATSNMGLANTNAFVRIFRWSYFDVAERDDRKWLGMVNTRFMDHFDDVAHDMGGVEDDMERYEDLGRIVSYVQLVSAPSRAVPVYTARFWRWSFGDRFDSYPLDAEALEAKFDAIDCAFMRPAPETFREVLRGVASDTLAAVQGPLGGLPSTWEAFWEPSRHPGDFGDYGVAGNSFGRRVSFPCQPEGEERCVLVEDDPLYDEFALDRQFAAVEGTIRAMYLHQLRYAPATPIARR